MTTTPYLRNLELVVSTAGARLEIRGLFIKFQIRWEASATAASGDIEVYNLADATETRISQRGSQVSLFAGYQDSLEEIARGDIRRVDKKRSGVNRISVIRFGGNLSRTSAAVFARTYEGEIALAQVVRDIIAEMPDMEAGDLSAIPADAVLRNKTFALPGATALTGLLSPLDLSWYEEDGLIGVMARGESVDDRYDVVISEKTGMVGTPAIADDDRGVKVRTLLDHRIRLDTRFRLESVVLGEGGQGNTVRESEFGAVDTHYQVVSYEHSGDNRAGGWFTDIEGRPIS